MSTHDEPLRESQPGEGDGGVPAESPTLATPVALLPADGAPRPPTLDPGDMQRGLQAVKREGTAPGAPRRALPPGAPDVVGNRYELLEALGDEEFAVVFRARDRLNGRTVAVKMLDPVLLTDAGLINDGFRRFAARIAALRNPGIVQVYDYGSSANGAYWLVMEHVVGDTLKELLGNDELRPVHGVELINQLAAGVAYIHGEGIIHRDLKPGNVLVAYEEKGDRAKLLDFGLARRMGERSEVTERGKLLGSLRCMSPELALGREVDYRTDIWSLGVLLYRVVTGRFPFDGRSAGDIMDAIQGSPFPPLTYQQARLVPGIETVIARCLEKKPSDRYQSARDLALAIKACLRALRDGKTPSKWVLSPPRLPAWMPSHRTIALATAAIILGFVLVYGVVSQTLARHPGAMIHPGTARVTVPH